VSASEHPSVQAFARHVNPALVKLLGVFGYGRLFTRARGCTILDHEGREYLDCLAGFGAVPLGHNHPRLRARVAEHLAGDPLNLVHIGPSEPMATLAARLAQLAGPPFEVALFSNSGSEAVEAGLKLARAATGRSPILYCEGSWHGLNLGALSVMGAARLRAPFEPLVPGCAAVPFGDLPALEAALARTKPAAFVVEPIQCEGGVVLPPPGYLAAAQEACRRRGTILVLDEVQTGLGRVGRWFAYQDEGFVPDVLVLAKALSGGLAPIGATLASAALHARAFGATDRHDLHGSTFAGNSLSCAVALETLSIIEDEGLVARSAAAGARLKAGLEARLRGHPLAKAVRGRGLLVGVELGPTGASLVQKVAPFLVRGVARSMLGQWAALQLLERGLVVQPTAHAWDVLRLEPPLVVSDAEVDRIVSEVGQVLDAYEGISGVVGDVVKRVGAQGLAGWSF
jgi:putrescine aminotransferase